jgi:hypothetical protein
VQSQIVDYMYPLHRQRDIEWFDENVLKCKNWFSHVKIHRMRRYFGEKISLYFAWTQKYINWLIPISVIGVICFVLKLVLGDE